MATHLDDDARIEIDNRLESGERLLWRGKPPTGLILRQSDAIQIPFSLLWCGITIFIAFQAYRQPTAPLNSKIIPSVFLVIGLYITIGRFFWDAGLRSETRHGVTDQRVIILSGVFRREIRSLYLEGLTEINISERENGTGTITFGRPPTLFSGNVRFGSSSQNAAPAFEGIDQPRTVLRIIREAQKAART